MNTPRLWRGQTLADRSTDRRESLLAAATALLGAGGATAVTMRAVVRDAALSPRYFYESFESREELLVAVYDRVAADLLDTLSQISVTGDARADVRTFVDGIREFFQEDPARARILLREPLADDTLRKQRSISTPGFVDAVLQMVYADGPPIELDLAVVSAALSGALVSLYLDYVDGRLVMEPGQLVEVTTDLIFAIAGAGHP